MSDIVDKLRFLGTGVVGTISGHHTPLMNESADLIEKLQSDNEALLLDNCRLRNLLHRWITCYPDRSFGLANESAIAAGRE